MTSTEAKKLIYILQSSYPRTEFATGTIDAYTMMLSDLPYQIASQAIKNLIATSQWLPTIAEIRRETTELVLNAPSAEEAWVEVREAIRTYSPYDSQGQGQVYSNLLVKKTVSMIGLDTMVNSTQGEWLAKQFKDTYENIKANELIRLQKSNLSKFFEQLDEQLDEVAYSEYLHDPTERERVNKMWEHEWSKRRKEVSA